MKLAFAVTSCKIAPESREICPRIAEEAIRRGHDVTIFAAIWNGPVPDGVKLKILEPHGLSRPARFTHFFEDLRAACSGAGFDLLAGFTKGPGLDVCFALDGCVSRKTASASFLVNPFSHQRKTMNELEKAVFDPASGTRIFYVLESYRNQYMQFYNTPPDRFHRLPPGLTSSRLSEPELNEHRNRMRSTLGLNSKNIMLFCKAANLKAKGADRILYAIAALQPTVRSWVRCYFIGTHQHELNALAAQLKLEKQVFFEGIRNNSAEYLMASDLTLLPSWNEAAGTLILESISSGVPVISTENCACHCFIQESGAGCVIPEPFDQEEFNAVLESVLFDHNRVAMLRREALKYAEQLKKNHSAETAVNLLEMIHEKK